jgi:hypothetical protein
MKLLEITKDISTETLGQDNMLVGSRNTGNGEMTLSHIITVYLADPSNNLADFPSILYHAAALIEELHDNLVHETAQSLEKLAEERRAEGQYLNAISLYSLSASAYYPLSHSHHQLKYTYEIAVDLQSSDRDEEVVPILHKIVCEQLKATIISRNFELGCIVDEIDLLVKSYTKLGQDRVVGIATEMLSSLKESLGTTDDALAEVPPVWFETMVFAMIASAMQDWHVAEQIFNFGLQIAARFDENLKSDIMKNMVQSWCDHNFRWEMARLDSLDHLILWFGRSRERQGKSLGIKGSEGTRRSQKRT